ncbi:MAG: hypothetical protein Fur0032_11920 [Terrimicrobiaceae bacterium]
MDLLIVSHPVRTVSVLIIAAVCVFHVAFSAALIQRSNQNLSASDQGAELWMAALSRADLVPQRTDGVRHPLFSWMVRHFYVENQSEFFVRGKIFNTALSTLFLVGLGIWLSRKLDPLALANALLLSSLGILVVRGTYFQPEPLYYILFFGCCLAGWKILRGAPAWLYPVFGLLCGLAFLAKPSLSPFLAAFACGAASRFFLGLLPGFPAPRVTGGKCLAVLTALAVFAAILTPLGIFSRDHFGKPFFNYPQVWMWMDDFQTEAWPWQDRHPGRTQLEAIPAHEWPSPATFFQRHSMSHAAQRLLAGSTEVATRFLFPEPKLAAKNALWRSSSKKWEQPIAHRGIGILLLAGLCVALGLLSLPQTLTALRDPGLLAALVFAAATLTAYTLLYGWYFPIGRGDRFMGSLWIPLVTALSLLARHLASQGPAICFRAVYFPAHIFLLGWLLMQTTSTSVFLLQGGSLVTRN